MANAPVEITKTPPAPQRALDPWASFRTEMERLFDRFSGGFGFPNVQRLFDVAPVGRDNLFSFATPVVDVTEDDGAYKIAAELPGLSEKDIDISLSGDTLVLKGEKRQEHEEKETNRYLCERSYGAFQRSFMLPDGVDRNKIDAAFAKGVLTITLPKAPGAQQPQTKIEVKAA